MDLLLEAPDGRWTRDSIETAVRSAIDEGTLAAGAALPSTRDLAAQLGVARGTVVAAIEQLAVAGLVETRPGAATRVTSVPAPARRAAVASGRMPTAAPPRSTATSPAPEPIADFTGGEPDLTIFPNRWWSAATRRVLESQPAQVLGYGDPRGQPALRVQLVDYLRRTRGVSIDPDHLVITAGFSHALAVLARVLRHRAGPLAVEDPSLWLHREVLAAAGVRTVPVPVDANGLRVDDLPRLRHGAVLVAPAHQTPLGVTLSPSRRSELVTWASDTDGLVVEDDYDGELRYDRRPVPALHARAPGRVVYCGSASKTLAPGIRLGWLAVPDDLVEAVTSVIDSLGGSPVSSLEQLVLADLIESGRYDAHVRSARATYRRRRDDLVAALDGVAPGVHVDGVAAGLKALVRLPDDADEAAIVAALAERSVAVMALGDFRASPHPHHRGPGLVLNFGRPYGHQYRAAIDAFANALSGTTSSSGR